MRSLKFYISFALDSCILASLPSVTEGYRQYQNFIKGKTKAIKTALIIKGTQGFDPNEYRPSEMPSVVVPDPLCIEVYNRICAIVRLNNTPLVPDTAVSGTVRVLQTDDIDGILLFRAFTDYNGVVNYLSSGIEHDLHLLSAARRAGLEKVSIHLLGHGDTNSRSLGCYEKGQEHRKVYLDILSSSIILGFLRDDPVLWLNITHPPKPARTQLHVKLSSCRSASFSNYFSLTVAAESMIGYLATRLRQRIIHNKITVTGSPFILSVDQLYNTISISEGFIATTSDWGVSSINTDKLLRDWWTIGFPVPNGMLPDQFETLKLSIDKATDRLISINNTYNYRIDVSFEEDKLQPTWRLKPTDPRRRSSGGREQSEYSRNSINEIYGINSAHIYSRCVNTFTDILLNLSEPWVYPQAYFDALTCIVGFLEGINIANGRSYVDSIRITERRALHTIIKYNDGFFSQAPQEWAIVMDQIRHSITLFSNFLCDQTRFEER